MIKKLLTTILLLTATTISFAQSSQEDAGQKLLRELNSVPIPQGKYSNKVPGGNVFLFCGGGRPSRTNPLRPVYDDICAGNTGTVPTVPVSPINTTPIKVTNPKLEELKEFK